MLLFLENVIEVIFKNWTENQLSFKFTYQWFQSSRRWGTYSNCFECFRHKCHGKDVFQEFYKLNLKIDYFRYFRLQSVVEKTVSSDFRHEIIVENNCFEYFQTRERSGKYLFWVFQSWKCCGKQLFSGADILRMSYMNDP